MYGCLAERVKHSLSDHIPCFESHDDLISQEGDIGFIGLEEAISKCGYVLKTIPI